MTFQKLYNGNYQIKNSGAVISATDAHNLINNAEHDCTVILERKRIRRVYEKIGICNGKQIITTAHEN